MSHVHLRDSLESARFVLLPKVSACHGAMSAEFRHQLLFSLAFPPIPLLRLPPPRHLCVPVQAELKGKEGSLAKAANTAGEAIRRASADLLREARSAALKLVDSKFPASQQRS